MCEQISTYFEDIHSKYQPGFRKEHNTQHCLLPLTEKWKQSADHGKAFGALLTDLSKAFQCLPHSLFIAKVKTNEFDNNSLKFVNDNFQVASKGLKSAMNLLEGNNVGCSAGFYIRNTF